MGQDFPVGGIQACCGSDLLTLESPRHDLDCVSGSRQPADRRAAAAIAAPLARLPATSPEQLLSHARGAQVLISNKVPLRAEHFAQLPELKLVAVAATGVNQIDLDAARAHGVAVCNVRNYGADAVAEHALMLMLALSRNLFAYRRAVLEGGWQQSAQFCLHAAPMKDLSARTLAVCGGGAIGEALAAKAAALGMRLMRVERKGAAQVRAGYTRFETALAEADVLSLHLPLNDDTRGLIGAAELALMKPDALLINTARGGLVDEAALLAALQAGRLGGAGLDVLDTEPPRQGNPLLDVELPNLIITPHAAWLSEQALAKLAQQLVDNIAAFLQGEPRNLVE